jgi:hypothetical protein|tara:strand:+ start:4327 stop:4554 length:228 start_codon:yes stop_codon:yes gene_type:complete
MREVTKLKEVKVVKGLDEIHDNIKANIKGKLFILDTIIRNDFKYYLIENEDKILFRVKASNCELVNKVELKTKKK